MCVPFLWTGTIIAFFHSFGKHSFYYVFIKKIRGGFEITVAHNFNMRIEIPSQPWALFGSTEGISLIIISVSILMPEILATVSVVWLLGRELSFAICLHCSMKSSLNRFALTKTSVTHLLFTNRGGINGNFDPLINVSKINQ